MRNFSFSKWRLGILVTIFLFFGVLPASVRAADTLNIALTVTHLDDRVLLTCDLLNFGAPTDNAFSQAYDLTGIDPNRGVIQVWGKEIAARDVNVFIQGSMSLEDSTMTSFQTRDALDDVDAVPDPFTAVLVSAAYDTLGAPNHVQYEDLALQTRFLRLMADGQTGNPAGSITYIRVLLYKVKGWQRLPGIANRNWTETVDTE